MGVLLFFLFIKGLCDVGVKSQKYCYNRKKTAKE